MGRISLNSVQHSMEKSLQVKVICVSVTSPVHVPIKILIRKFSPLLSLDEKKLFNDISIESDNSAVNQSFSTLLCGIQLAFLCFNRVKASICCQGTPTV